MTRNLEEELDFFPNIRQLHSSRRPAPNYLIGIVFITESPAQIIEVHYSRQRAGHLVHQLLLQQNDPANPEARLIVDYMPQFRGLPRPLASSPSIESAKELAYELAKELAHEISTSDKYCEPTKIKDYLAEKYAKAPATAKP